MTSLEAYRREYTPVSKHCLAALTAAATAEAAAAPHQKQNDTANRIFIKMIT